VAKDISKDFYNRVCQPGMRLGEALQQIRQQWKEKKNLTYLAYVLYGDPLARVRLPRPRPAAGPNP